VQAQADGITDILAANANLRIKSSGGIGTISSPLETQVKNMDLWNTDSGGSVIIVEQLSTVALTQVNQQGTGAVDVRTQAGDITVLDLGGSLADGIWATSGSVSLYAGAGAVNLHEDIRTTGGGVSVVAESGNILLDSGIRVIAGKNADGTDVSTGNIVLRAATGSILTAASAAQWLKDGASFDKDALWAMENGRYVVNAVTGLIQADKLSDSEIYQRQLANGQALRTADGAYLQTTGGNLILQASGTIGEKTAGQNFSPLAIVVDAESLLASSSSRADVSIIATGAV
jgi:hypothetical protein